MIRYFNLGPSEGSLPSTPAPTTTPTRTPTPTPTRGALPEHRDDRLSIRFRQTSNVEYVKVPPASGCAGHQPLGWLCKECDDGQVSGLDSRSTETSAEGQNDRPSRAGNSLALALGGLLARAQDPPPIPRPQRPRRRMEKSRFSPEGQSTKPSRHRWSTIPSRGVASPRSLPRRSRRCHRTRSRPARTYSGFPATGAGIRQGTTSSGSAESGASRRRAVSGCPATGTRLRAVSSGFPATGSPLLLASHRPAEPVRRNRVSARVSAASSANPRGRPDQPCAGAGRLLVAWKLVLAGERYLWRPGFWATAQMKLGLDSPSLRLHARRIPVRRGILGPSPGQPRPGLRAGLLSPARLHAACLCLHSVDHDRHSGPGGQPVRHAGLRTLLLWRLLRPVVHRVGIFPWFSFSYISGPARPDVLRRPVFTFYVSINVARDPGLGDRVQQRYVVRRDNVAMRPPRTLYEQTRIIERNGGGRDMVMARSIHELASRPASAGGMRFERLSAESQRRWQRPGPSSPSSANSERRSNGRRRANAEQPSRKGGAGLRFVLGASRCLPRPLEPRPTSASPPGRRPASPVIPRAARPAPLWSTAT